MLIYALIYTKYIIICNKYNKREKEMMEKNKCDESENLLNDEDIDRAARSLKAMSHPLRLKILCVLGSEQLSVQQIVDAVGTSQSNISQHLSTLRDRGILESYKDANRVFYGVEDKRTLKLISMMKEVFCRC